MFKPTLLALATFSAISALPLQAHAQDGKTLNLYSARHYSTDEALYSDFTKQTGIKINRVDADDSGILTRLRAEGAFFPSLDELAANKEAVTKGWDATVAADVK